MVSLSRNQASVLTNDSANSVVVSTGIPNSKWKDLRIKHKYIMRVLTSAQIEHGIHVIACGNQKKAEEIAFRIMRHVNDL